MNRPPTPSNVRVIRNMQVERRGRPMNVADRMAKLRDSIDRRMAHIAEQTQKLAAEIDELAGMGK